jgi:hypothetical protein
VALKINCCRVVKPDPHIGSILVHFSLFNFDLKQKINGFDPRSGFTAGPDPDLRPGYPRTCSYSNNS